ncbi:MAG: beta strand repeat-containing protein, partial [Bdellovibrionales bacterium]
SGWASSTVSSVISGTYFSQNGNSFGAEAVLGTNDTRPLHFETDGATRMTVGAGGNVGVGTTNPAGMLDVRGGTAAAGTSGSSIFLIAQNAGTGAGVEAAGGSVTITAGNPTGTGAGSVAGSVSITGGSNVSMAGGGGHVTITGGAAASGNKPGNVVISAGASSNSVGGNVTVQASAGAGNNNGGTLTLNSGAGAGSNAGGLVSITAGSGGFSSTGGNVSITAGAGGSSSGNAGSVTINGGTPVSGAGGSVSLTAKAGVGTNQNGGNITLTAGAATGSGTAGTIQLLSGNVGVGTTAPSLSGSGTVVHVHDSGGNASAIHLTNSDSGVAATDGSILGLATDESLVLGSYEATPILFLSSGSERVRISSAGNVGVGTTTPNALLDVAGTMRVTTICDRAGANCKTVSDGWASGGGGGDLPAADGTAAAPSISFTNDTDTGLFRPANGAVSVTSNGAVTAQFMSGSLLLGSQQDGSFGNLSVVAVQQNASLITYDEAMVTVKHFQNDTPDTYPRLDLLNYRGTPGAPARVLQGDTLGSIGFGGPNAGMSPYLGSGAGSVIKSYATADWDTNSDSDLRFYTTSASTTNEAVRISDTGNVGIGTTSPIARLHIARPSSPTSVTIANEYLHFGGDYQASNGYHLLGFGYRSPSGEIYPNAYMGFQETSTAGSGKGDLVFGTRNVTSDSVPSEAMRITAGGNVGIGITNPTVKLHVEGAIQAKNLAASITPTTAFWSTAPTSLTNVTDRNDATSSTEGVVAAGESALVTIDLGAVYRGIVFAYAKIRSGAAGGTAAFGVYQSDDNSTYAICSPGSQIGGTTLQTVRQQCAFWGRYIHLVCNADAVGTGKCTFYEVYFQQYQ